MSSRGDCGRGRCLLFLPVSAVSTLVAPRLVFPEEGAGQSHTPGQYKARHRAIIGAASPRMCWEPIRNQADRRTAGTSLSYGATVQHVRTSKAQCICSLGTECARTGSSSYIDAVCAAMGAVLPLPPSASTLTGQENGQRGGLRGAARGKGHKHATHHAPLQQRLQPRGALTQPITCRRRLRVHTRGWT